MEMYSLKLQMPDCPYAMIPSGKNYPVWTCRHEEGHGGIHQPREGRGEIRDAYFLEGKALKTRGKSVTIIEPGHEVDWEVLVKRNKNGGINTQSSMGKLIAALTADGSAWDVKAGLSKYQAEGDPGASPWTWIEAARGRDRLVANAYGITFNGDAIDAKGALEAIG